MTRQSILWKNSPKMPLSSFWVGHLVLGVGPALKCGLSIKWYSIEENYFFLGEQFSIWDIFLVRDGRSSQLPPFQSWNLIYRLELWSPSAFCHIFFKSWCVWKVLFYWHYIFSLALTTWLPSLKSSLSPEGRGFIETFHLGLGAPRSLTICMFSSYESLHISHLLKGRNWSDDG